MTDEQIKYMVDRFRTGSCRRTGSQMAESL